MEKGIDCKNAILVCKWVITNAHMRAMKNNNLASDKCARKKKLDMKLTKFIL